MIIEERRRALWLKGRFWATKILNTDELWFPRGQGQWINLVQFPLEGGVRVLLPNNEYELNDNLSLADRGTGCDANRRPIFNQERSRSRIGIEGSRGIPAPPLPHHRTCESASGGSAS
jgi:hypothetical protein